MLGIRSNVSECVESGCRTHSGPEKRPRDTSTLVSTSQINSPSDSSSVEHLSSAIIAEAFAHSVDSPLSPEELRQLKKQMKRASNLEIHHGHKAASFEASSLSSVNTSNRTTRELALDDLSLVRTTSIKSNDNSASPRNRPESIQSFGKGFFHRRGKPKRESSAQSSSVSLAYAGDMPTKNAAGGKGIIPSIFSRRKQSRYESAQRRGQNLGPFNFHYVTHTQRNNVCNSGAPVNGAETLNEASTGAFEAIRYPLPRNMSSDSMGDLCEAPTSGPSSRPLLVSHHTAPASEHGQLLRHILPLEKLRKNSSQRLHPSTCPTQVRSFSSFTALPPPRVSSQQSCCQDSTHAINIAAVSRAQINNEFCQPHHFSPEASGHIVDDSSPHGQNSSIQQEHSSPDENQYCGVMLGARDSTWPMAISTPVSYETLPDVAEEEEHYTLSRRSWLSLASSDSSLQSTQSVGPVPMLPSLAESERPTSGGSETLGGLGIMRFNSTFHEDPQNPAQLESPTRESWEDLIDLCYEQGAEADCDYRWERLSLNTDKESIAPPAKMLVPNESGLEPKSD